METDQQQIHTAPQTKWLDKKSSLLAAAAFCIIFLYRLITFILRAVQGNYGPFGWWYLPVLLTFTALGGISASLFLKNRKALLLFSVMALLVELVYFASDMFSFVIGFLAYDFFESSLVLSSVLSLIPYLALVAVCAMKCRSDRFTNQYWYVPGLIALSASILDGLLTLAFFYIGGVTWFVLNFIFIDLMFAAGILLIGWWARQEVSSLPQLPEKTPPVFEKASLPAVPDQSGLQQPASVHPAETDQTGSVLKDEDVEQLRRLKILFDEGVLNEEEFEQKKKNILGL